LKQAYAAEFASTIERAEKQIILARHGRRLLNLLDDSPVVPGDTRNSYEHGNQARQILNDAEDDLKDWQPDLEEVISLAYLDTNSMVSSNGRQQAANEESVGGSVIDDANPALGSSYTHDQPIKHGGDASRLSSSSVTTGQVYAPSSINTGTMDDYPTSEAGVTPHQAVL
jgi:hypothetical protein